MSVEKYIISNWRASSLILSRHTCCRVSFPPWRGLHAANNRCRCSYFSTFQYYLTSSWRTVGVWYVVSLEIATPEQIKQSGFNAITQTILWPKATKLTWLTAQEEHRQLHQFRTPFLLFCISCTINVTQFTLCKQFQQFMHFPDSSHLPVGYSGSAAGNLK